MKGGGWEAAAVLTLAWRRTCGRGPFTGTFVLAALVLLGVSLYLLFADDVFTRNIMILVPVRRWCPSTRAMRRRAGGGAGR